MKDKNGVKKTNRKILPLVAVLALSIHMAYGIFVGSVFAASLTNTSIRLNRIKTAQTTSARVVFRTVGAGATSVAINFNGADASTWTGSSGAVNATQTAAGTAGCDASATALPGTLSASGTGSTVTITGVTALSAATVYCVDLTSATAVTNPTSGEYHPTVTAGADSTTVAVRVISDDQIVVVTGSVAPSFNFVLDANTTSFSPSLDAAVVRQTTARTVTVTTNATNGWIAWAKDLNTGLTSAAAAKTIASTTPGTAATLVAGTEGYVVSSEVTSDAAGGGTVTIPTAYQGTSGNSNGSGLDATFRQIASSTGTAGGAGDVLTIRGKAAISGSTPAANDYTDTWTIIGAGAF